MYRSKIIGLGGHVPENVVTNFDLEKLMDTSNEWIVERTGIHERRFVTQPCGSAELALPACHNAIKDAGISKEDIELIIAATTTPEHQIPGTSSYLQALLELAPVPTLDIRVQCSGFIYGLATVEKFIQTGQVKTALVVGGEVLNPFLNWEDRNSCILFGDGAGAAIVEQVPADSTQRILSSHMLSDGNLWELFHMPAGGSNMEVTPERYSQKLNKFKMKGKEIFKIAVKTLSDFANYALTKNQMTVKDLDWFVPHQANRRIIEAVANRLNLPMEKVLINVDRYGNTSAATIPTALDEAARNGTIKRGQTVLLDAFGAGLTYGSILLRW